MKNISLIGLAILIGISSLLAQDKKPRKRKKNPELRKELRTHYQNNMYPVLQQKQAEIDAGLNAVDLATVNASRMEYAQLKAQAKEQAKKRKAMRKEGTDREEIKAQAKQDKADFKAARKGIEESLFPLIENNEELIKGVMLALKPLRKQWKEERKAIREKYVPADENPSTKSKGKKKGKGKKAAKEKTEFKKKQAARFLIWDRNKAPKTKGENTGKELIDQPSLLGEDEEEDIFGDD